MLGQGDNSVHPSLQNIDPEQDFPPETNIAEEQGEPDGRKELKKCPLICAANTNIVTVVSCWHFILTLFDANLELNISLPDTRVRWKFWQAILTLLVTCNVRHYLADK